MTDIATLQMLPVDEDQDGLSLRCRYTSQTICTVYTCGGGDLYTDLFGFVFESDE